MKIVFKRIITKYGFTARLIISILIVSIISFTYSFLAIDVGKTNKKLSDKYEYLNVYETKTKDVAIENLCDKFTINVSSVYNLLDTKIIVDDEKNIFVGPIIFANFDNDSIPNYYKEYLDDSSFVGSFDISNNEIIISNLVANILLNGKSNSNISIEECRSLVGKSISIIPSKYLVGEELYTLEKNICNHVIAGIYDSRVLINKVGGEDFLNCIFTNSNDFNYELNHSCTRLQLNDFLSEEEIIDLNEKYEGIYYGEDIAYQLSLLNKESTFTKKIFTIVGVLLVLSIFFNLFILLKSYIMDEKQFDNLICSLGMSKKEIKKDRIIILLFLVLLINVLGLLISSIVSRSIINNIISDFFALGSNYLFEIGCFSLVSLFEWLLIVIFIEISYCTGKKNILLVNKNI